MATDWIAFEVFGLEFLIRSKKKPKGFFQKNPRPENKMDYIDNVKKYFC
jgi:hypothetical protein